MMTELKGSTWAGRLVNPKYRKRGSHGVDADFEIDTPVKGSTMVWFSVESPKSLMKLPSGDRLNGMWIRHLGAKPQDIGVQIPEDQFVAVKQMIGDTYAAYTAEQEKIKVTSWRWKTSDLGGVRIVPVPSKDTPEIFEIQDRVRRQFRAADLMDHSREVPDTAKTETVDLDGDKCVITIPGLWEIDAAKLNEMIAGKDAAKTAKYEAALKIAKETGTPSLLRKWTDECDDPNESCSMDQVFEEVHPDGSIRRRRQHTW